MKTILTYFFIGADENVALRFCAAQKEFTEGIFDTFNHHLASTIVGKEKMHYTFTHTVTRDISKRIVGFFFFRK